MAEYNTVEELKAPLLAAVGAADLALATVNEILSNLRDRAEVAGDRMDDRRAALTRLQEKLPRRSEDLRGKLTTEELRKAAEEFLDDATETYNSLVVRGEAALERLMGQQDFKEAADRVEGYVDQAVELTPGSPRQCLGADPRRRRAGGEAGRCRHPGQEGPGPLDHQEGRQAGHQEGSGPQGSGQEGRRS